MTFYKVINFSSYHIQTVVKANAKYCDYPKALPNQGIINYREKSNLLHPSLPWGLPATFAIILR